MNQTATWQPTDAGAKRNPKWWKSHPTLRHPKPAALKPQQDKSLDAYAGRLGKLGFQQGETTAHDAVGCDCGQGFYIVATDGHRALLRRGAGPKGRTLARRIGELSDEHRSIPLSGDLTLAVQRVKTCADENKGGTRAGALEIRADRIIVSGHTPGVCEAAEWVPLEPIDGHLESPELWATRIKLDVQYLLDGMGRPGRLHYLPGKPNEPIVIETDGGDLRYVLMPVRS